MDVILQIIEYIFTVAVIGGVLYAVIYYIDYTTHKKSRDEIALLEAKLITLKMALKIRIRVKANSFRSHFAKIISEHNEIEKAIGELTSISYDNSADFQKHFDVSKQINTLVNTDRKFNQPEEVPVAADTPITPELQSAASMKALEEFMGPDYKNELSVIRIIKEISDARLKLNKKIEAYNEDYKDQKKRPPLKKVEILEFSALADINTIFKSSDAIFNKPTNPASHAMAS